MDVLIYLASYPNQVLTRESILNAVWKDTHVEEIALTRSVSELRKIFDDDPRHPKVIETIHKRGYRLIAEVRGGTPPTHENSEKTTSIFAGKQQSDTGIFSITLLKGMLLSIFFLAVAFLWLSYGSSPTTSTISLLPGTTLQGNEIDPALSPDGSQLAFVWKPSNNVQGDIFVKSIDAGVTSMLQLTDTPVEERNPSWSPVGNQIAFVRFDGNNSSIYVIPSIGGTERKIVQTSSVRYPKLAWSAEGKWLAYSDNDPNESVKKLHMVHIDSKERNEITLPPSLHYGDFDPAFSPDGSKIVFVRGMAKGIHDIYVLDRNTQALNRITRDNKRIGGLAFSQDGSEIIYSSDRGGTVSLWAVSANGGDSRWLSFAGERVFDPVVPSKNNSVAYEKWQTNIDIMHLSLNENKEVKSELNLALLSSSRDEQAPVFSPDGQQLVFVTSRSGSPQIWIADADGQNARMLIDLETPMLGPAMWSPDGRSIVYNSRSGGNADIYTYNIETGQQTRITTHAANDITPNYSRDDKTIYFGSDRDGTWQLYKTDLQGKVKEKITNEGGFFAIESVDGNELFISKANQAGIWRVNVDGSTDRIIRDLEPHQWYNWQVISSGIYYIGRDEQSDPALKRFKNGETVTLRSLASWPETPGFTLSPDGNNALLAFETEGESDIMIAQFE